MLKKILLAALLILSIKSYSQTINWNKLQKSDRHILSVNAGIDYSLTAGLGYSYQLKTKTPIILNVEFAVPFGKNLLDDYKSKIGATIRLAHAGDFNFAAKINGIFRRYENDYVRLINFGSEIALNGGYYQKNWFLAGEAGFDKAIVTNFKHTAAYKEVFPAVVDGWYEPSTGGNVYFGLQSGLSMKHSDLTLRIGKVINQDFKSKPNLPFYALIGYAIKINDGN